jgi:hypothetical protein
MLAGHLSIQQLNLTLDIPGKGNSESNPGRYRLCQSQCNAANSKGKAQRMLVTAVPRELFGCLGFVAYKYLAMTFEPE